MVDSSAVTLRLHWHRAAGEERAETAIPAISARSLTGVIGTQTDSTCEGAWRTITFRFSDAEPNSYLGFAVEGDSAYPKQRRFVRAADGVAEAWILDGDPRVYAAPERVDPSLIIERDGREYLAIEDLAPLLDLMCEYGTNDYEFDGAREQTAHILRIHRDRDTFDIGVDSNRIGQNVTGSMLRERTESVFADIDGFSRNGRYHLSLGCIRWLFQVGTLSDDDSVYILPRQFTAYNLLQPVKDPADVGFCLELDAIDRYVLAQASDGGPSLAISIVKDGTIVKQAAYGFAKRYDTPLVDGEYRPARLLPRQQWEPAGAETLYDLASNTKMYAANYAIQRLVSQGRLDLDRALQSFPGWENYTDAATEYTGNWTVGGPGGIDTAHTGKANITVRDLLHHTAGELPDPQYPNLSVAGRLYYQNPDVGDRSGIIDAICRTPLIAAPRTRYLYSDVDFMILGILVEQITGQTLDAYLQDEFYGPLGLAHTTFTPLLNGFTRHQVAATELNGNTRDGNVSFGVLPGGIPVPMRHETIQAEVHDEKAYYSMGGVSGHAGLFSTVGDLAVLTQLMLNGGIYDGRQYFTQDVAEQFTTPYSLDPAAVDTSTIGLGWRVQSKTSDGYCYFNGGPSRSAYGHVGWAGTLTVIDPAYGMTITILTNMRHSPVVDPPNGFASRAYAISALVPVCARIYAALQPDGQQDTESSA